MKDCIFSTGDFGADAIRIYSARVFSQMKECASWQEILAEEKDFEAKMYSLYFELQNLNYYAKRSAKK